MILISRYLMVVRIIRVRTRVVCVIARVIRVRAWVCSCISFYIPKQTAVASSDRQLLWRLREQGVSFMASSVTQW